MTSPIIPQTNTDWLDEIAEPVNDFLPEELEPLKKLPHWILWKMESRDGKPTKVPFQVHPVNGKWIPAKSDDPSTWAAYDDACKVLKNGVSETKGLGFEHGVEGCGIVSVDFDGCIGTDGNIAPWALDFINQHLTYVEKTPSGSGLRALYRYDGKLTLPNGKTAMAWPKPSLPGVEKKAQMEVFVSRKFITVTGDIVGVRRPIADYDGFLDELAKPEASSPATKSSALSKSDEDRLSALLAGNGSGDRSKDDFAACCLLARKYGADHNAIDKAIRGSKLNRDKWNRPDYKNQTIKKAIESELSRRRTEPPDFIEEDENDVTESYPEYPQEVIDGDLLGDLTRALTDGTPLPPQFVREQVKVILGAALDGKVVFQHHPNLSMRHFNMNVSQGKGVGKGETWLRVGDRGRGFLSRIYEQCGIVLKPGSLFGSGEHFISECRGLVADENQRLNLLVYYDEYRWLFEKVENGKSASLLTALTTAYEANHLATGSLVNKSKEIHDLHLSMSGGMTVDNIFKQLSGSGQAGSGFLSRMIMTYGNRMPFDLPNWEDVDHFRANAVVTDICKTVAQISGVLVPEEDPEATELRGEFFNWLRQQSDHKDRLEDYYKRDVLFRCVFSGSRTITREMTEKSIAWTRHQFEIRQALWPDDGGSPTERMERAILNALAKYGDMSERKLAAYANVWRKNSGGFEVFNRALISLSRAGRIVAVGVNRKGKKVYGLDE